MLGTGSIPARSSRRLTIVLLALAPACADRAPEPDAHSTTLPIETPQVISISMSRQPCFGICPAYSVEVDESGHIRYVGNSDVEIEGSREAQVDPGVVLALADEIIQSGFMNLSQEDLDECPWRITDHPSTLLTIRIDGDENTTNHYHGCYANDEWKQTPVLERLTKLEDRIDELLATREWVHGP